MVHSLDRRVKPEITLFSDLQDKQLIEHLERDYNVRRIFSGSSKPVIMFGSNFMHGYGEIYTRLLDPCTI